MTRNEKRFLSRRECAWCQHRLDWDGCGAIYEKCTAEQLARRRAECLKDYKPRKRHLMKSVRGIDVRPS